MLNIINQKDYWSSLKKLKNKKNQPNKNSSFLKGKLATCFV